MISFGEFYLDATSVLRTTDTIQNDFRLRIGSRSLSSSSASLVVGGVIHVMLSGDPG
jgi:hypothetical protein